MKSAWAISGISGGGISGSGGRGGGHRQSGGVAWNGTTAYRGMWRAVAARRNDAATASANSN